MENIHQTVFVLVRHGQTVGNQAGLFTGHRTDVDLSPLGMNQAQATAAQLIDMELQISAVFSSPLSRALNTATKLAAPFGHQVEVDERLSEFDFGEFEGRSVTEVHAENPGVSELWRPDQTKPIPGGESAAAVADRVCEFFADTAVRFDRPSTILVVGHMASFAMGLARLLDDANNALEYAVDNCSLTLIEWEEPPRVVIFNQIDHIQHLR